ncbi:type IV toxin-antitoxin system AbiEi family antitoxin domain-containing protein [Gryllotalpicola protaetiae]|nr:type IV toxin-antitoxin system AbiEi family antitoxin domain-containing protein [Gryllotalpicola protaetiae]
MRLFDILDRNHGFTTREDLRRAGLSQHAIRKLLESGRLVAFTRDVLGRPNANPAFGRAVQMNSRAACVTAAHAYGVWVLEDSGFHVVTRSPGGKFRLDGRFPVATRHWTPEPVEPDRQLLAVESIRNSLAHIARCQPLDAAVASFDSAVRLGLLSLEEAQRLASRHRGRFAEAVALTTGLADSGLESLTRVRLGWAGIPCREQVVIDGHPVDLLIGERLVIQLDGKQHLEDPVQLARDRVQDRRLQQMGYTVLRFGYAEVVFGWDAVLAQIEALLAGGADRNRA